MRLTELKAITKRRTIKTSVEKYHPSDQDIANAIKWYQDGGYHGINGFLRNIPDYFHFTPEEMMVDHGFAMTDEQAVMILLSAMRDAPKRSRTIRTYRGDSRVGTHQEKLLKMEIGESYIDPAFVSSTFDPNYAFYGFSSSSDLNAMSMLIIPPSIMGLRLAEDTENEFLLAPNCSFTLVDKTTIPVRNKGYRHKWTTLMTWRVSA